MLKLKRKGGDIVNLTVKIKLKPNKYQSFLLEQASREYIHTVNKIVSQMLEADKLLKLTSKHVKANLPSAVKNQAIRDAKSVYRKSKKLKTVPVLKKPVCIWNNQNYNIKSNIVKFPVMINGKSKQIPVKALFSHYQKKQLENKIRTLRITKKSGKWIAQICIKIEDKPTSKEGNTMGVDLGLKVPAVAITDTGKTKFFGNGRQNKYMKRKFRSKRKELGKAKKLKAINKLHDKEQRWMKDQDHKISKSIVSFAIKNNVSEIRLEKLTNIRNTAKTSRRNEKNLHTWSFYRLAQFIEYKAALAGIQVEYVDPKYTSQICPQCKAKNKVKDRNYTCECGFKSHRDRVGAINIINAPVIDGKSLSA